MRASATLGEPGTAGYDLARKEPPITAYPPEIAEQIRQGKPKFAAMTTSYVMGVFNDNFFRIAVALMAMNAGSDWVKGMATALFAAPYLLFAAPAGWLADRFSKRRVVIGAKLLEVVAMIAGVTGIFTHTWWLLVAMVSLMGLQSCLFSPALNGSIPELFPRVYVTKANAVLKAGISGAILLGQVSAGFAIDPKQDVVGVPLGRWIVAGVVLAVAGVGALGSLGVAHRPPADPRARFPWAGPVHTVKELARLRRDPLLGKVLIANVYAWFIGSVQLLLILEICKNEMGYSDRMAGYMIFPALIGTAIGGAISARLAKGPRWYRVLPTAGLAIAVCCSLVPAVRLLPPQAWLGGWLVLFGLLGASVGSFMIPCESFIQVRPPADRKGTVWAAGNFAVFVGIVISGVLDMTVTRAVDEHVFPGHGGSAMYGMLAALALPMAVWLWRTLPGHDAQEIAREREEAAQG